MTEPKPGVTTTPPASLLQDRDAMVRVLSQPVDEEMFLYAMQLFLAAASLRTPVENPESKSLTVEGYGTVAFADMPMNRGLMAIARDLAKSNVSQEVRMAVSMRVMSFGEIIDSPDLVKTWGTAGADGIVYFAEPLLRACAVARVRADRTTGFYDLEDVDRQARAIEARNITS